MTKGGGKMIARNQLYSLKGVARLFHVPVATIRRWADQGRMPYEMVGQEMRFTREDIEEYLTKCRIEARLRRTG